MKMGSRPLNWLISCHSLWVCRCISSICFGWNYPSAPLIAASHFPTSGRFTLADHVATDLTPRSRDWPRSKSLWFSASWPPWPSDPPPDSCTVGSPPHTGTSSRCPGTRTGLPHYSRCSWEQPAQSEPSDTPGERPGDLRQGRGNGTNERWCEICGNHWRSGGYFAPFLENATYVQRHPRYARIRLWFYLYRAVPLLSL